MSRLILPFHSYTHRSKQVNSQRLVNCFVESVTVPAKTPITLLRSHGIKDWLTLPTSPVRGFGIHNDLLYAVAGAKLYSISSTGTVIDLGTISGHSKVHMASNGLELVIVSEPNAYAYEATLNKIVNVNFTSRGAANVGYIDGFMMFIQPDSQNFFASEYLDATNFDPLNFDVAIGAPDKLVSIIVDHRQIFLFGTTSTEIWYNAGTSGFPFLREQNGFIEVGCGAGMSPVRADNSIFWLDDKRIARRLVDLTPQKVSTNAIEQHWQDYETISDAYSISYTREGHWFWALTFPSAGITWEFDISTNEWHERSSRNVTGGEDYWRVAAHVISYGENIVGDSRSGKVGTIDSYTYTEWGELMRMEWTYPSIYAEGRRAFHKRLQIEFEAGVGLTTGQGSDPQVMLSVSDDGGTSFTAIPTRSIGRIGQYRYRSIWNRLGSSDDRVYRASVSDPVRIAVVDSQVEVEGGHL